MSRRNREEDHQTLLRHVNNLDLDADVRQKILVMVTDPPPPEGCLTIQDALARGVLARSGSPDETERQKHVRVCFYALVYFPGHVVPDHHYLSFATGTKIREGSQELEVFRRNASKRCEKMVSKLNLTGVAFKRVNASNDSTTGAGFRLTSSGHDFVTNISLEKRRKAALANNHFVDSVSPTRIRQDMLRDPLMRELLAEMQATANLLSSEPKFKALLESVKKPRQENSETGGRTGTDGGIG